MMEVMMESSDMTPNFRTDTSLGPPTNITICRMTVPCIFLIEYNPVVWFTLFLMADAALNYS